MAMTNATPFNVLHNPYIDNFASISGSDVVGIVGHVEFLNLQGISVSVNREVNPIYVMGRTDPISFVRGKRGIAGSLVTICNDRGALYDIAQRFGVVALKVGDYPYAGRNMNPAGLETNLLEENDRLGWVLTTPQYYDQLPPFDVTLVGRNENLVAAISRIGGIYIVSMGTGISVDDNAIEQQMTFVALYYEDWRPAGRRRADYQRAADEAPSYSNPFFGPVLDIQQPQTQDALGAEFFTSPFATRAD